MRAELHERFADWLETTVGEQAVEYEEIVGYHLEQAFRYRAELGPRRRARVSRSAGAPPSASVRPAGARSTAATRRRPSTSLSRAVSLLPPDDPARVDLIPNIRVIQGMSGDLSWAHAVLDEAIAAGDERLEAHARVQRAFLRLFTEPEVTSRELIEVAERADRGLRAPLGDELGLAREPGA